MFIGKKIISCVGYTLDKCAERERKLSTCAVCPFIGFQPQRPERPSDCKERYIHNGKRKH